MTWVGAAKEARSRKREEAQNQGGSTETLNLVLQRTTLNKGWMGIRARWEAH